MPWANHPLLTVLGRRGRGAVLDALQAKPGPWNLRRLAAAAGVHPVVAQRSVDEFQALGLVTRVKPGRDVLIRYRDQHPWAPAIASPWPPSGSPREFARAYRGPGHVRHWANAGDDALAPVRLAIVATDDEAAEDAIGPALDAVTALGWPAPEVTVHHPDELEDDDPIAKAIRVAPQVPKT